MTPVNVSRTSQINMDNGNIRSRHNQISVIEERCKGCGFCIEFCPQHVLHKSKEMNSKGYHTVYVSNSDKCTGCNLCSMICPDFAINVVSNKNRGNA